MPTNIWLGTSIPNAKVVRLHAGTNVTSLNPTWKLGLGSTVFTFTGWDPATIVDTWNNSSNPFIQDITAALSGQDILFTCNNAGQDFELTCDLVGGVLNESSTYQTLTFGPAPSGGTFTITVGGLTTGNISYSATPATFASNMHTAIAALSGFGTNDVLVTYNSGSYLFDFSQGRFSGTSVDAVTATHTSLTGGNSAIVVVHNQVGNAGTSQQDELSFPIAGSHTATLDEIQTLFTNATSGTFSLTVPGFGTSPALPFDAGRSVIRTALEELVGVGNVDVSDGPLFWRPTNTHHAVTINFQGDLAGTDVPQLIAAVVSGGANEVQRLTMTGSPTGGTFTLTFGANTTSALPYTASPSAVETALTGLASIGAGNLSVTGTPFTTVGGTPAVNDQQKLSTSSSPDGTFTITFGGQTTSTLHLISTASAVSTALQALSSIGSGNVAVTGGPLLTDHVTGGSDPQLDLHVSGNAGTGKFTMTYKGQTTASLYQNSSTAQIQAALEALSTVGVGNVSCTGAGPLISPNLGLNTAYQAICIDPSIVSGTFTITFGGQTTSALAYNATQSTIFSAISGLSSISGNISHGYGNANDPSCGINAFWLIVQFTGPLASNPPLMTTNHQYAYVTTASPSSLTTGLPSWTNNHITINFINTEGSQAIGANFSTTSSFAAAQTGGVAATTQFIAIHNGSAGSHLYINADLQVTFIGTMAATIQSLMTINIVSGAISVAVSKIANGAAAVVSYTYGSMTATFQGSKSNLAEALITSTSSLTGGSTPVVAITELVHGGLPIYVVTTTQDGGIATVENISGGTFGLRINGQVIDGIPYNVSADALVTIINNFFGSVVVSATGGPAPDTPIFLTFLGTLQKQPITLTFINSLSTNTDGSVEKTVISVGSPDPVGANVWDLTVCPGNGTMGVLASSDTGWQNAEVWLTITNNLDVTEVETYLTPVGLIHIPLQTISALTIEAAINEALASDACRVVQIGRSQEWSNVEVPAGGGEYGGSEGAPAQWTDFWYMKDVYRITFINQFAASGCLSITASFPIVSSTEVGPSAFMIDPETAESQVDVLDYFPEVQRVVIGFNLLALSEAPIHLADIVQSDRTTQSFVGWRFKLQTQFLDSAVTNKHTGNVPFPATGQIRFVWNKKVIHNDGSITYTALLNSVTIDWNSPASVIQTVIANMLFGVGNVTVTGGLAYSWLSERLLDAPTPACYQDLKVSLTGLLYGVPIDEFEYELTCSIVSAQFDASSAFQKNFRIASDYYSRSLPPHFNKRERVSLSSITNPITLSIGLDDTLVTIPQTATAAQVQTALDSLYPLTATLNQQINGFPVFPDKLMHPVFVYGTTFGDGPMDFEFTSFGFQSSNEVTVVVSSSPQNVIVGLITVIVAGVSAKDDIQTLTITGSPYSGTYTISFGGNTTSAIAYNASLSTVQAALAAASPSAIVTTSVTGNASTGFIFDWAAAGGPQTSVTGSSSLNNVGLTIVISNIGGADSTFAVTELVKGRGPNYLDDSNNFSLGRVLNSSDTFVADDSASPIMYGLDQSSVFAVLTIGASPVVARFIHTRKRKVFDENQTVLFKCVGTPPTGLTADTVYTVVDTTDDGKFSLSLLGTKVSCTTIGSGTFTLVVSSLTVNIHNQFGGQKIGLPHLRGGILEYLNCYWKAYFDTITIGIGSGNGFVLGRFDTMDGETEFDIGNTASSDQAPVPAILILADNAATTIDIGSGDVGVAYYAGESSVVGAISITDGTLTVNNATVTTINKGAGATFKSYNTTVDQTIEMS